MLDKQQILYNIEKINTLEMPKDLLMLLPMQINKYGIDNFKWEVIENNVPGKLLNKKEAFYIEKYNSFKNGYNSTEGGDFNPMNYKQNRVKVSKNTRGKKHNIDQYAENNPSAILNWNIVEEIRELYRTTSMGFQQIADKYNISRNTAGNVIKNTSWVDDKYIPPKFNKRNKINTKQARDIRNMYATGQYTYSDIAKIYNVCFQTIGLIVNKESIK